MQKKIEAYYCEKCQNVTHDFMRHGRAFGAFCPVCQCYTRHKKALREMISNTVSTKNRILLNETEEI